MERSKTKWSESFTIIWNTLLWFHIAFPKNFGWFGNKTFEVSSKYRGVLSSKQLWHQIQQFSSHCSFGEHDPNRTPWTVLISLPSTLILDRWNTDIPPLVRILMSMARSLVHHWWNCTANGGVTMLKKYTVAENWLYQMLLLRSYYLLYFPWQKNKSHYFHMYRVTNH